MDETAGLSRRHLLAFMAATGGALSLSNPAGLVLGRTQPVGLLGGLLDTLFGPPPPFVPPASVLVARGDDGLFLALSFVNLEVRPRSGGGPRLALRDPARDGYVVVGLPPQSILERAVFNAGGAALPPLAPIPALLSGPSRIVLTVARGAAPVGYDLPTLLDLAAFPLAVTPIADAGTRDGQLPPADVPPDPARTAIEAPYRLFLSPPSGALFSAVPAPVARNGRTELWHARAVAARRADGTADHRPNPVPVRAIWTPDLAAELTEPAWAAADNTVALTPQDRTRLVAATTTTSAKGKAQPADASLLLVSPMGASLDVTGAWPSRSDVVGWRHRSWLARDNYVKVETPGFLFPFGFRAVRVKITERILGGRLAFLRKREFIVVRQPTVAYDDPDYHDPPLLPQDGRMLPFRQVTTTTLVSPPLSDPNGDPGRMLGKGEWVRVNDAGRAPTDLRFGLVLTGRDGRTVTSDLPLAFVEAGTISSQGISNPAYSPTDMLAVVNAYARADESTRRTLRLGGQRLGFVTRTPEQKEDPSLPTFDLVLLAVRVADSDLTAALLRKRQLNAYPVMKQAQVRLEALDALVSPQAAKMVISFHPAFAADGLKGANRGEVWAQVASPPMLSVPQKTGGGLAAPSFKVEGLSLAHGPVADASKIALGEFNPAQYFNLDSITLLGGVPLKRVIAAAPAIADPRGPAGANVPKVISTRTPDALTTRVTWRPTLKSVDLGLFAFKPATAEPDSRLDLEARFVTDLRSGASTTAVTGQLRNFALDFLGALTQPITLLRFESHDGGRPSLDVQLGKPAFAGDLRFLNDLQDYLPALPGGAKVDITPRGVTAGLTIAIPSVPIGVVLVENLSIGVELDLPFNGDQASLGLSFATREHPFHVTVMALGGGGFLGIGLGLRGIQRFEGSLEFGASVALNFGVASGSVSIMAGIYFKYDQKLDATGNVAAPPGNTVVITGYVRAIGELSVLGLIHATLEFYLGLTFAKPIGEEGKVQGTATVSVRVEVLLFSTSVSITLHKEFGSGVDPSFGDQISAGDWSNYCAAFAA